MKKKKTNAAEEMAAKLQLRLIQEQCRRTRYCAKLGGECKYMLNGECSAAVCGRSTE